MLSQIASKVYLITINSELAGENTLIDKVKADKKIEIICNVNTKKIIGEQLGGGLGIQRKRKFPNQKTESGWNFCSHWASSQFPNG